MIYTVSVFTFTVHPPKEISEGARKCPVFILQLHLFSFIEFGLKLHFFVTFDPKHVER